MIRDHNNWWEYLHKYYLKYFQNVIKVIYIKKVSRIRFKGGQIHLGFANIKSILYGL